MIKGYDYAELFSFFGVIEDSEDGKSLAFVQEEILKMATGHLFNYDENAGFEHLKDKTQSFIPIAREFCEKLSKGLGVRSSKIALALFETKDDGAFLFFLSSSLGYLWY